MTLWAQVTVRLVGADEQTAMYLSPAQFSWLPGTGVAAVRSCPVTLVCQTPTSAVMIRLVGFAVGTSSNIAS